MGATIPGVSRPTVQQEVVGYLEKTVNALPPGTYLDGSAMPVGGRTAGCPDADPAKPTVRFEISMTVVTSPPMRSDAIASQAAALWRSWGVPITTTRGAARPGWTAEPRPGYRLQIAADQPPTISVASVCFPDDAVLRDLPFPAVISHSP